MIQRIILKVKVISPSTLLCINVPLRLSGFQERITSLWLCVSCAVEQLCLTSALLTFVLETTAVVWRFCATGNEVWHFPCGRRSGRLCD